MKWALVVAGAAACSPPWTPPSEVTSADPKEEACLAQAAKRAQTAPSQPDAIKISQILVHHAGVKRPKEGVTRTRGQACMRAAEARDKVLAGAPFEQVVASYSDEAGAATRAGMVGEVKRSDLDPAVADAAFDLDAKQMSDVVESQFGFHLVFREE